MAGCSPKEEPPAPAPAEYICDIVSDGSSDYRIVIPSEGDAVRFAADELQAYIEQSTGVRIPVMNDRGLTHSAENHFISLGKTVLLEQAEFDLDYSLLNTDGFFVKTSGKTLFIDGETERGVIYGVYDFLERELGVRFVTAEQDHVPVNTKLELYSWDRTEAPAFASRAYLNFSTGADAEFVVKKRMAHELIDIPSEMGGNVWASNVPQNHNSLKYVDPAKYSAEDYPELYAKNANGEVGNSPTDICWTYGITDDGKIDENIQVSPIRIAIESLKQYVLESDPNARYFMFGQMDGEAYCRCERCMSDAGKYRRSGIALRFVNILADEIQKWANEELDGREIIVVFFSYIYTLDAPVKYTDNGIEPMDSTVVPRKNVAVRQALLGSNIYYAYDDPKQDSNVATYFAEWSAIHDKFFVWTYHANWSNYFDFTPSIHNWAQQLTYLRSLGVADVFMQGQYNEKDGYKSDLEAYVASKMLWDPEIDVNALIREFHCLYFGADAQESVDEYMDRYLLNVKIGVDRGSLEFRQGSMTSTSSQNFPLQFVLGQIALIDGAIERTNANKTLTREQRDLYVTRLIEIRLYAKYMQLNNYLEYYNSYEGQNLLAEEFASDCRACGKTRYSEYDSLNKYLEQYNI